jgi:hypothetical protein
METYLTIIQYQTEADQVFLVQNSLEIYAYHEDPITETSAMLCLMNEQQKNTLLSKGFKIQTIDKNPDLQNFSYIVFPQTNQGYNLAYLGEVYTITDKHTLIKFNDSSAVFDTNASSGFEILPLKDIRNQLANKNNVAINTNSNQSEDDKSNQIETTIISQTIPSTSPIVFLSTYILISSIILIALLLTVAILYWKKSKTHIN